MIHDLPVALVDRPVGHGQFALESVAVAREHLALGDVRRIFLGSICHSGDAGPKILCRELGLTGRWVGGGREGDVVFEGGGGGCHGAVAVVEDLSAVLGALYYNIRRPYPWNAAVFGRRFYPTGGI